MISLKPYLLFIISFLALCLLSESCKKGSLDPIGGSIQGTSYQWAHQVGISGGQVATGLATDSYGNVYVAGRVMTDTVTFGDTTVYVPSSASFVAKYSPSGSVVWGQVLSSTGTCNSSDVRVDALGNCYVAGRFSGIITIGNTVLSAASAHSAYIIKFSPTGSVLQSSVLGGSGSVFSNSGYLDPSGNFWLTGSYQGAASLGNYQLPTQAQSQLFVAKFDANATVQWVTSSAGNGTVFGNGLGTDGAGNSYVVGSFTDSVSFGNLTIESSGTDFFVLKLDPTGNPVWARKSGSSYGFATSIAVDDFGNSFVAGSFVDTMRFGTLLLTNDGSQSEIYLLKLDAQGNGLWGKAFGAMPGGYTWLALDQMNNCFICGGYHGSLRLDNTYLSSSSGNIFVAGCDTSGKIFVTKNVGVSSIPGTASTSGFALDGGGNFLVDGTFQFDIAFDDIQLKGHGGTQFFVVKISRK